MQPEQSAISAEIIERIHVKLQRRAICDVLRICANNRIPPNRFSAEIANLIEALYESRAYGVILSAYYDYGQISSYTVTDLLLGMFACGDYPGFLKQALRFGFYHECPEQIEAAIAWHRDRGFSDADAWSRKFTKLRQVVDGNA